MEKIALLMERLKEKGILVSVWDKEKMGEETYRVEVKEGAVVREERVASLEEAVRFLEEVRQGKEICLKK